jgi:hypothetical protein
MFIPALPELVISVSPALSQHWSAKKHCMSQAQCFFIAGTGCFVCLTGSRDAGGSCTALLRFKKRKLCRGGQNRRKRPLNGMNAVFSTAICSSSKESPGLRKSFMTIFANM